MNTKLACYFKMSRKTSNIHLNKFPFKYCSDEVNNDYLHSADGIDVVSCSSMISSGVAGGVLPSEPAKNSFGACPKDFDANDSNSSEHLSSKESALWLNGVSML